MLFYRCVSRSKWLICVANTKYIRPPFFIGQLNAAAPDSTLTIVYVVVFVYLFIISANMWGDNFALNVTPILYTIKLYTIK